MTGRDDNLHSLIPDAGRSAARSDRGEAIKDAAVVGVVVAAAALVIFAILPFVAAWSGAIGAFAGAMAAWLLAVRRR